jgi:predicted aldo/keto reductase-like oxidoreductase
MTFLPSFRIHPFLPEQIMERRDFLKSVSIGTGLAASAPNLLASQDSEVRADETSGTKSEPEETIRGEMRYRTLGRTGEKVSAIGLGGFHIGVQPNEKDSIKIIRTAIARGITFLDNSWDYHMGGSEVRMGKALRDGYRDKIFLMTKIDGRTAAEANKQLDDCLKRLQTDRIDLVQHHEVIRLEDPDRIFAQNGANDALVAAKKAGKIRYIGFTGHKDPLVHLRMLQTAEKHGFHFDTVQMPLNVMDAHFRSFGRNVVPVALEQGIGILGMKPLASGQILISQTATPLECLHYALSLPTSVVITGIDSLKILDQAFEAVKTFQPLNSEQMAALLKKTAQAAENGRFEPFKTTNGFDATARHPEWLG